jgi:hypothetical protein
MLLLLLLLYSAYGQVWEQRVMHTKPLLQRILHSSDTSALLLLPITASVPVLYTAAAAGGAESWPIIAAPDVINHTMGESLCYEGHVIHLH